MKKIKKSNRKKHRRKKGPSILDKKLELYNRLDSFCFPKKGELLYFLVSIFILVFITNILVTAFTEYSINMPRTGKLVSLQEDPFSFYFSVVITFLVWSVASLCSFSFILLKFMKYYFKY